jgi:hypothetical protein
MEVSEILGIACGIAFMALLFLGGTLVVVGTIVRKTPFGINFKSVNCPECGEPAPTVRVPENMRQTLLGGATCSRCGCEFDKWGNPIEA